MPSLNPSRIATEEARRLALVLAEVGGEGAAIDSGWMACDEPGSWAIYAAGLGLDGAVAPEDLNGLVDFYRARGRRPRIQVTSYEHPTLAQGLAERGFVVYEEETLLARELGDLPSLEMPDGLQFRRVDPTSDADVAAFCGSQMAGFYEDGDPPPGMMPITERVARSSRVRLWLLEWEGRIVGSGGLEASKDSGVMIAGCVYAGARRRGFHNAFIAFRLHEAVRWGLEVVTVGSIPGGPTERNARRAGFIPIYTQAGLEQR